MPKPASGNYVGAPGLTQALETKDGTVRSISYGNSDNPDNQEHAGSQLRVADYGPGAANVSGLTDQSDPLLHHPR